MRLIIAIILIGLTASAQDISFRRKRPVVASCTTPTGSTLTESFGDASTSCWSGGPSTCDNTWTASGSIHSIVSTPGSPADNTACANSFQIDASASSGYIYRSLSAPANTAIDIYFYFRLESATIGDYGTNVIGGIFASGPTGTTRADIIVRHSTGGSYQLRVLSTNGPAISTGTWYKVRVHLEDGAGASHISVNDGTQTTFTQNALDGAYLTIGAGSAYTIKYQIGCMYIN